MYVCAEGRTRSVKKGMEPEFDCLSMTSSGSLGSEAISAADPFDEIMDRLIDSKSFDLIRCSAEFLYQGRVRKPQR